MNKKSILSRYFVEDKSRKKLNRNVLASKSLRQKVVPAFVAFLLLTTSILGIKTASAERLGSMYCLQTAGTDAATTIIKNGTTCLIAFTKSTNWRIPSGITSIRFLMVGGGGGGASDGGGGGGGGGGIDASGVNVTPGILANVVVGTGGASSSNGSETTLDLNGDGTHEWRVSGGLSGEGFTTRNGGNGGSSTATAQTSTTSSGGHGGKGPNTTASAQGATNASVGDGFRSDITGKNLYYGGGGGGGIAAQDNGNDNTTFGRAAGGFGGGGAGAIQLSTADTADNRDVSWSYKLDGSNAFDQINLQANCLGNDAGLAHASKGFAGLDGYGGGGGGGAAYGNGCSGTPAGDDGERTDGGKGGNGIVLISYTYSGNDATFNSVCNQTVGTPNALSIALTNGNCVLTFSATSTTWTVPAGVNLIRILLVGGGAGGKNDGGGGGGGGGVISATNVTTAPGNTVRLTVGLGGGADSGTATATQLSLDGDTNYEWIANGGQLGTCFSDACGRLGGNSGSTTIPNGVVATVSDSNSGHGGKGPASTFSRRPATNDTLGNGIRSDITGTNIYYGGGGGGGVSGGTTSHTRQTEINGGLGGFGGGGAGAMQRVRGASVSFKYKVDGLFGTDYLQSLTANCAGNTNNAQGMTKGFPGLNGFGGGGGGGGAYGDGCSGNPSGDDGERTDGGAGGDGALIISYPTVIANEGSTLAVDLDASYTLGATDTSVVFDFSTKLSRPASGWSNSDLIAAEVAITTGSGADDAPVFRGSGNCKVDLSNDATEYGFGTTEANGTNSINGYSVFILNDRSPQLSVQGSVAAVVNVLKAAKISCDTTAALVGKYVRVGAVPTVSSSTCSGTALVNGSSNGTVSCGDLYYVFSTKHYYRLGTVSTGRGLVDLFSSARTMTIPVNGTNKTGATMYGWVATLNTRDEIIVTNSIGSGARMIGTTDKNTSWAWDSNWGTPSGSTCATSSGDFKWLGPDVWCRLVPNWNNNNNSRYWKLNSDGTWTRSDATDYTIDLRSSTLPTTLTESGAYHTNGYGFYHSWHTPANGATDEPNNSGEFAYQGYSGASGDAGWDDANDASYTQYYAEFCSGTTGNTCTPPDGAVDSTLLKFAQTTVRYANSLPVDPRATTYTATNFNITNGSTYVLACINSSNSSGSITSGILTFDISNTSSGATADTSYSITVSGAPYSVTISGDKSGTLIFYGIREGVAALIQKVVVSKVSGNFSTSQYVKLRTGPWYTGGPTNCDNASDVDTDQLFQIVPIELTQKRSVTVTIKKGGAT